MRYGLYYNYEKIGDVLLIVFESNTNPTKVVKNGDVVALYKEGRLVGINIFNFSKIMKIRSNGFITNITPEIHGIINHVLVNAGLEEIPYQADSGFVVGKILDIEEHPDSEHLHILTVDTGKEKLQVVCGAANVKENMKVVLALPYTFMPNGQQIIPSKLLGIESFGMCCSGRELNLDGFEGKRGLLELDDNFEVGQDFFNA